MAKDDRYLVISDTQIPFEHVDSLSFCKRIQKEYRIPKENVLHVGDETDQYFGSLYSHNPNATHSPRTEIEDSKRRLREWYRAFPLMRLAVSNHMLRSVNKATAVGIPSQVIKPYRTLIEAPKTWRWEHEWIIKTKHPFRIIHGMGYSGLNGARNAALDAGISTAIGHLHSCAGIAIVRTTALNIWAMNVGCLIDNEAYAFQYNKNQRNKPAIGVGVVVDSGKTPIWVPL